MLRRACEEDLEDAIRFGQEYAKRTGRVTRSPERTPENEDVVRFACSPSWGRNLFPSLLVEMVSKLDGVMADRKEVEAAVARCSRKARHRGMTLARSRPAPSGSRAQHAAPQDGLYGSYERRQVLGAGVLRLQRLPRGRLEPAVPRQLQRLVWQRGTRLARTDSMRAPTPCSLDTAPALQIALNRREDFVLARVFGDVERNEAAIGQPDVCDDRAVGAVVEMKKGTGFKFELGGSRFTQLAELAKLV